MFSIQQRPVQSWPLSVMEGTRLFSSYQEVSLLPSSWVYWAHQGQGQEGEKRSGIWDSPYLTATKSKWPRAIWLWRVFKANFSSLGKLMCIIPRVQFSNCKTLARGNALPQLKRTSPSLPASISYWPLALYPASPYR